MRAIASGILCALPATIACADYALKQEMSGKGFFDAFNFVTYNDPTHGYVNYVDVDTAWTKGYVSVGGDNKIYIGVDFKTISSGRGRDSVRLESKQTFTTGLFVLDLEHMPHGCGTWPAWWTCGPDWPYHGEIDVIEGVHDSTVNLQTLHTSSNCSMPADSSSFTGSWQCTNCDVWQTGNAGCSIQGASYGAPFNANRGGVYAMEWTNDHIQVFFFPRDAIPSDVLSLSPHPDTWGKPTGYWPLGGNCAASHFDSHQIIFDNTFCGDWAGNTFASACPQLASQSCNSYVQNNPGAFQDAYWLINTMRVFQK